MTNLNTGNFSPNIVQIAVLVTIMGTLFLDTVRHEPQIPTIQKSRRRLFRPSFLCRLSARNPTRDMSSMDVNARATFRVLDATHKGAFPLRTLSVIVSPPSHDRPLSVSPSFNCTNWHDAVVCTNSRVVLGSLHILSHYPPHPTP